MVLLRYVVYDTPILLRRAWLKKIYKTTNILILWVVRGCFILKTFSHKSQNNGEVAERLKATVC